ncbi:LysR family transcriptional regulator [Rhizobium sp. 32-5/1]|uniref:LysR family transcriptional regulator n=1 Tax=Rhizobium sp. 32-5/1 TaxID=3019602 RepID=UPI0032B74F1D
MQNKRSVSLNAVRIFVLAARHLSILKAATEVGLTPSAVSHQIKKLEGNWACLFSSEATTSSC